MLEWGELRRVDRRVDRVVVFACATMALGGEGARPADELQVELQEDVSCWAAHRTRKHPFSVFVV